MSKKMNVDALRRVLNQWHEWDALAHETPFRIVVRSSVPIAPGEDLAIDTLEITEGEVVAVVFPTKFHQGD